VIVRNDHILFNVADFADVFPCVVLRVSLEDLAARDGIAGDWVGAFNKYRLDIENAARAKRHLVGDGDDMVVIDDLRDRKYQMPSQRVETPLLSRPAPA
jgi:hypothetical protein